MSAQSRLLSQWDVDPRHMEAPDLILLKALLLSGKLHKLNHHQLDGLWLIMQHQKTKTRGYTWKDNNLKEVPHVRSNIVLPLYCHSEYNIVLQEQTAISRCVFNAIYVLAVSQGMILQILKWVVLTALWQICTHLVKWERENLDGVCSTLWKNCTCICS